MRHSGPIPESEGDTWAAVNAALYEGVRGLKGGNSLVKLLTERRGRRNIHQMSPLSIEQILAWTDAHYRATGRWPTAQSGKIAGTDEVWMNISAALRMGLRTLPGGSSLARLLTEHRGVRNRKALPPLNEDQIFAWVVAHHVRTGTWPTPKTGPIVDAPGETWRAVDMALSCGRRRLLGGSSLAKLLARKQNQPIRHPRAMQRQ